MNKIFSNLVHWKTSFIGLVFLGGAFLYGKHTVPIDKVILFSLIGLGIFLLFAPDTFIRGIKSFINKNKNKQI